MKTLFVSMLLFSSVCLAKDFQFMVPEMVCSSCSSAITKQLKKIKEIKNIEISIDKKTVAVQTTEGSSVTADQIKSAINAAGFDTK